MARGCSQCAHSSGCCGKPTNRVTIVFAINVYDSNHPDSDPLGVSTNQETGANNFWSNNGDQYSGAATYSLPNPPAPAAGASPFGSVFNKYNYKYPVEIYGPSPHNDNLLDSMVSTWVHEMFEVLLGAGRRFLVPSLRPLLPVLRR